MLVDQNVKSVAHRYEEDTLTDLPGPTNAYWVVPYSYKPLGRVPTALEGLKLLKCYDYQACEDPEWKESEAFAFCEYLTDALITLLPGYEEASWEWDERAS